MSKMNRLTIVSIGLVSAMLPFAASAQTEEPAPTQEAETTTTTTTTTTTVVTTAPPPPPPAAVVALTDRAVEAPFTEDVTTGSISAGGALNTGNTSSATFSAAGNFRIVRDRNAFEFETSINIGAADATPLDAARNYDLNTRNWNSRARYDRSFTDMDAAYLSMRHRWDTFAGLDTRLQFQVGYLRNFVKAENHRFWGEVGYDFTWDNIAKPQPLADNFAQTHSARLFLGYQNHLNEHVEWLANVETLLNFQDVADVRVNADTTFRATVATRLALELQFKLQFDNVPVDDDKEEIDTQTTVRLVYTLF